MSENRIEFKAIVTGEASKDVFTKKYDTGAEGKSVLQNCKVTEGVLAGQIVSASRTILNKLGEKKEAVPVGTEVKLYLTRLPKRDGSGGIQNLFEISTGLSASQDTLNALLDGHVSTVASEQLNVQQV